MEKVKTFRKKRNILAVNSLLTYKGNLFTSVGATGEFWKYNQKEWTLEHKLPENQPWIGTTWGRTIWKEELWFGGLEAQLEDPGVIVHYDGNEWETIRPKVGPEIWGLTHAEKLYAIDSEQIVKTENGTDWQRISTIPEGEGRSIAHLEEKLYVGTSKGLFSYSLIENEWKKEIATHSCYDIIQYNPFNEDWLLVGTGKTRGGPYYIFDGEQWHPIRIGAHMSVERIKMTTHGEGKGCAPLLFIPQSGARSGPFGGQSGLGRLYVTDWSDFSCIFESACTVTDSELYDGEIFFGTAWNKSYESLQGTVASVYKRSNLVENSKKPAFKYRLWYKQDVSQKEATEAIFCPGYPHIWIGIEVEEDSDLIIEVDPYGTFEWKTYERIRLQPGFTPISLSNMNVTMLRLKLDTATTASAVVNIHD